MELLLPPQKRKRTWRATACTHSFFAACLCVVVLVTWFGCALSPVTGFASLLQVKHEDHIRKDGFLSSMKSDLSRTQSLPENALAKVVGSNGSLADDASSKETALKDTETKTPGRAWPLLFCWSVMQLGGYEEALIKFQLQHRFSIFACDGFAVFATKKKHIGMIDGREVFTWANPAKEVSKGQLWAEVNGSLQTTNSWLNTATFLQVWDKLMHSKRVWSHDFVVKVDTDSIFFPDRLRPRAQAHIEQPMYFRNCPNGGGTDLYGAIEVFSVAALGAYRDRGEECKKLSWQGWSEDYYMDNCMAMIGVQAVMDSNQVGDAYCNPAPCSDGTKVAFHHFKDVESWERCHNESVGKS